MDTIFLIWIVALVLWFVCLGAIAFHVTRYSSPKDKLILSFFILIGVAGMALFWAIKFVSDVL